MPLEPCHPWFMVSPPFSGSLYIYIDFSCTEFMIRMIESSPEGGLLISQLSHSFHPSSALSLSLTEGGHQGGPTVSQEQVPCLLLFDSETMSHFVVHGSLQHAVFLPVPPET